MRLRPRCTDRRQIAPTTLGTLGHQGGIEGHARRHPGARLDDLAGGVTCCILFEVAKDQIVSGREHFVDLYAWDEFWA